MPSRSRITSVGARMPAANPSAAASAATLGLGVAGKPLDVRESEVHPAKPARGDEERPTDHDDDQERRRTRGREVRHAEAPAAAIRLGQRSRRLLDSLLLHQRRLAARPEEQTAEDRHQRRDQGHRDDAAR